MVQSFSTTQLCALSTGSVHYWWVQIFDKNLKHLIYLDYWRIKHWKCLVCQKNGKTEDVRKYFVNPKIENDVSGWRVNSLFGFQKYGRRSRSQMFFRIGIPKKFTRKHLCWSFFLRRDYLFKRGFSRGAFLWNLQNFLEHLFLQNTSGGWFWKHLMNSLFIVYENDYWCHFMERIGSRALISFYCVCFVFFFFFFIFFLIFFCRFCY